MKDLKMHTLQNLYKTVYRQKDGTLKTVNSGIDYITALAAQKLDHRLTIVQVEKVGQNG